MTRNTIKVGDVFRVKSTIINRGDYPGFTKAMEPYLNKIVTIASIHKHVVYIQEDNGRFIWLIEWFKPVVNDWFKGL